MQTLVLDPGGCTGRLRSCPFLGEQHNLRIGWTRLNAAMVVTEAEVMFWQKDDLGISFSRERYKQFVSIAVDRCFLCSQASCDHQNSTARGSVSCEGERMSGNAMER